MDEKMHEHNSQGDPHGGPTQQNQPPYWRRAHRDWRVWVAVIAMLIAMVVYLMSGDLTIRSHGQQQQPISAPAGNPHLEMGTM